MKALLILSILVPVGLLATLRLTGTFGEPPKVKRTTLEPVTLAFSRPSETMEIIDRAVQNQWTQEGRLVIAGIELYTYLKNAASLPFDGHDGLVFKSYLNCSFEQEQIKSVKISYGPLDKRTIVFISENPWSLSLDHAALYGIKYLGTNESDGYIEVNALNSSFSVSDQIYLVFLDTSSEGHELQITAEIAYSDETSIETLTVPIQLKLT